MLGVIKKTAKRPRKGSPYGFIVGQDGRDYYFPLDDTSLTAGQKVQFEGSKNERGFVAEKVTAFT